MLFFSRKFFPFFTTFAFGAFNDNLFRNALVIMITYQSGLDQKTASALSFVAMALLMLPQFPFSSIAGEVADRFPQQNVFRILKMTETILMILTTIAFLLHSLTFLLILLFLIGTQAAFFSPVKYAYVPRNLPDELVRGNAYVSAGTYLAILLGTICGNRLIVCESGKLWTGGVLIVCSVLGYLGALYIAPKPPATPDLKIQKNILSGTWSILKTIFRDFTLRHCVLGLSIFWMAGALYVSQLAGFCKEVIGAEENLVMAFTLLFSVGVALGSCLCSLTRKHLRIMKWVPVALILMALFTFDLFFASKCWVKPFSDGTLASVPYLLGIPSFWRFSMDLLLLAVCGGYYSVPLMSLLQKSCKKEETARVVAGNNIVNAAMIGLGSLGSAALMGSGLISVEGIFVLTAAVNFLTALYLISLRKHEL